eukprot:4366759-Karenia_brevis.AAC.1
MRLSGKRTSMVQQQSYKFRKFGGVLQHLALKHKQMAAGAKMASDNTQSIIQELGNEIQASGQWSN